MFDDFHAGHFRKHQVEDDGVGLENPHGLQAGLAVGRGLGVVAFDCQLVAIDVRHNLVIFNEEDFFHF